MKKYVFVTPERLIYKANYDSPEPDFIDMQVINFDQVQTMEDALEDLLELNNHVQEDSLEETYPLDLANENRQYFSLEDYQDGTPMAS